MVDFLIKHELIIVLTKMYVSCENNSTPPPKTKQNMNKFCIYCQQCVNEIVTKASKC